MGKDYPMHAHPATMLKAPLLTAAQMRGAEAKLFQRTSSWDVMQRAGREVAHVILKNFSPVRTVVCCGPGNNGGDGWIIAQELREAGWQVAVVAARAPRDYTGDARNAALTYHGDWQPLAAFKSEGVELIVDALFGIGLHQALSGDYVPLVAAMQSSRATVVAVDIASGVHADTGEILGCAVKADTTITFAAKKCGVSRPDTYGQISGGRYWHHAGRYGKCGCDAVGKYPPNLPEGRSGRP